MLSILLPVYNGAATLERAVASVLAQSSEDWELVLIDDGSTDGSGALCDAFAAKDGRVRAIHLPNGGVSAARNAGMEHARGEIIGFLDADDELLPEYARAMLEAFERNAGLDAARAAYRRITGEAGPSGADRAMHVLRHGEILELAADMQRNQFFHYVWRSAYRADFLRGHGLRFRPGLAIGEDTNFMLEAFLLARQAIDISVALYCYCENPGGAAKSFALRENAPAQLALCHGDRRALLERFLAGEQLRTALRNYAENLREFFLPLLLWGMRQRLGRIHCREAKVILSGKVARFVYEYAPPRPSRKAMDGVAYWLAKYRLYGLAYLVCKYLWLR